MIPAVCIVGGKSNSGKTTLMEKLIKEVKSRGYKVATIKHRNKDFDIDLPGKDSWRHAQAGSDLVIMASPNKLATIQKLEVELPLDDILATIKGVDIILIEGYKGGNKPKIEVFRSEFHDSLYNKPEDLFAIVSDIDFNNGVPCFELDDAVGLVDLIELEFSLKRV